MTEFMGKHSANGDDSSQFVNLVNPQPTNQYARRDGRSGNQNRSDSRNPRTYRYDPEKAQARHDKASRKSVNYHGYEMDGVLRKSKPVRSIVVGAIAIVVLGLLLFGGFKLVQSFGLFGSSTTQAKEVSVFIPEGSSTSEIAKILKREGVIKSESSFILAVQERGVESQLLPGQYTFTTGMTDDEVIDALLEGPVPTEPGNKLTIPEGLTLEQTARIVEQTCGIPAQDFINEAYSADKYLPDYPLLEPALEFVYNNSLEGFLYPKTYFIPEGSNAEYVIRVLLNQFVIEVNDLDMSYAEPRNINLYDVVVIASMIEKETAQPDEKALISSVIYNRLRNYMPLQICATVIYAMGIEDYDGHPLLESDLATESLYNTYFVEELPIGPICSPHISSIVAAAHPAETDYFYYVLTSEDGRHTFCKDEEEFAIANEKYHALFGVPN